MQKRTIYSNAWQTIDFYNLSVTTCRAYLDLSECIVPCSQHYMYSMYKSCWLWTQVELIIIILSFSPFGEYTVGPSITFSLDILFPWWQPLFPSKFEQQSRSFLHSYNSVCSWKVVFNVFQFQKNLFLSQNVSFIFKHFVFLPPSLKKSPLLHDCINDKLASLVEVSSADRWLHIHGSSPEGYNSTVDTSLYPFNSKLMFM